MSCCGRVTSTGATVAERSNMAQRKKVAEQIETEAVAKKLSYLGFQMKWKKKVDEVVAL